MCWYLCVCVYLTFAGVGGSVWSLGVSVEARLACLTLRPFGVVQTLTQASTALARLTPRRPIKLAALSVSVTLTLWCLKEEINTSATRTGWRNWTFTLKYWPDIHLLSDISWWIVYRRSESTMALVRYFNDILHMIVLQFFGQPTVIACWLERQLWNVFHFLNFYSIFTLHNSSKFQSCAEKSIYFNFFWLFDTFFWVSESVV